MHYAHSGSECATYFWLLEILFYVGVIIYYSWSFVIGWLIFFAILDVYCRSYTIGVLFSFVEIACFYHRFYLTVFLCHMLGI